MKIFQRIQEMKKNEEERLKELAKAQKRVEKDLLFAYRAALYEIRLILASLEARYGELTQQEMNRYNRMKNLSKQINDVTKRLNDNKTEVINKGLSNQYEESYYRSAHDIEQEINAFAGYALLSATAVEIAVQLPIDKLTLNERLRKHRTAVTKLIRDELTLGFIKGESFQQISKRIKGVLENDAKKAIRVARTEGHRIQETANFDAANFADEQGVNIRKIWLSTLDHRTRDAHQELDMVEKGMNEDFVSKAGGKGKHPGQLNNAADDVNCRCRLIKKVNGILPTFRRRARNPETGKNEVLPRMMNYREWKKTL
jgi:hypothetical protein